MYYESGIYSRGKEEDQEEEIEEEKYKKKENENMKRKKIQREKKEVYYQAKEFGRLRRGKNVKKDNQRVL